jgi:exodeoxyribonuclease VII large subunit
MLETSSETPAQVRVISEAIRDWIGKLGPIWVEGELSQLDDRRGSSMIFMRLKDLASDISISVSCHRSVLSATGPLAANARIKIFAKVNFYTPNGSLSLNAREIYQVGLGELLARLEALKKVLAQEGLFALERKKPLPFLPRKIGLICGRNSAAEKDVVENAKRRWPAVEFEIREVAVQGTSAVAEVSSALKELDAQKDVDVIIITRGGGSFEDLLPFSDEGLVRLVASSSTPIVSAIGHEQDTPLLDLVADLRASTPTDAAKRVVPDLEEELSMLKKSRERLLRTIVSRFEIERGLVHSLATRPIMKDPRALIHPLEQALKNSTRELRQIFQSQIALAEQELLQSQSQLRALSPAAVLDRGYSVVKLSNGSIVRRFDQVKIGDPLNVLLSVGQVDVTVSQISEAEKK